VLKQLRPRAVSGSELWEQHWRDFAQVRFDRTALKWDGILDLIDERIPAGLLLEAGCGLGKYLLYVRQHRGQAIGIDFAVDALQTVTRRAPGTPVIAADLSRMPFAPGTFETVLCFGVLEHFEQGAEAQVRALTDLLKPGGWLIATVPYANWLKRRRAWSGTDNIVEAGAPFPPGMSFYQHCFTRREARALVASAGCEIIRDRRVARLFWLLGRRTNQPRASAATRTSSGTVRSGSSAGLPRAALREAAYLAQWLIPGDLTAHMIAIVGRKPAEPGMPR
jgi:SAM-dependent methyltransferase